MTCFQLRHEKINNFFVNAKTTSPFIKSLYGHIGLIDLDVGEIVSKGNHKFDPFRIELKGN